MPDSKLRPLLPARRYRYAHQRLCLLRPQLASINAETGAQPHFHPSQTMDHAALQPQTAPCKSSPVSKMPGGPHRKTVGPSQSGVTMSAATAPATAQAGTATLEVASRSGLRLDLPRHLQHTLQPFT